MDWYAPIDDVLLHERDRVVTRRRLDPAEPYFRDHFPGRPVLPGVLAIESLVRAGRVLLGAHAEGADRWVLASARAVRFSSFLTPGQWLVCDVKLVKQDDASATIAATAFACDQEACDLAGVEGLPPAVSGRLVLRPARPSPPWNHPVEHASPIA